MAYALHILFCWNKTEMEEDMPLHTDNCSIDHAWMLQDTGLLAKIVLANMHHQTGRAES